jgi:hypothetical protein
MASKPPVPKPGTASKSPIAPTRLSILIHGVVRFAEVPKEELQDYLQVGWERV